MLLLDRVLRDYILAYDLSRKHLDINIILLLLTNNHSHHRLNSTRFLCLILALYAV